MRTPSGFWTFVSQQLATPLVLDDGGRWRLAAQERIVLGFLCQVSSTDRDALSRLIRLSEQGNGEVRKAARRLYARWQDQRNGSAVLPEPAGALAL